MEATDGRKPRTRRAVEDSGEELLTFLSGGSWLTKISSRGKRYRRFYYFDRTKKYICYSSSSKFSQTRVKLNARDIVDVRHGFQTDVFNKLSAKLEESCCFSVIFCTMSNKPLNLVAEAPEVCATWVKALRFLQRWNEKLRKQQDEKVWITDYFCSADTTNDGQLDFKEIWSLLQRMSVNITKEEALRKFNEADQDQVKDAKGNVTLNLEEFVHFYHALCLRPEVHELFASLCDDGAKHVSPASLQRFMRIEQKETDFTLEDTIKLIQEYEPSVQHRQLTTLSEDGFYFLVKSPYMNAFNRKHQEVYQDMTQPLAHYFIASSHNTYLLQDQLKGPSSIEGYIRALMAGCKCVELDCWDGPDNNPIVYHGYTLTSKILFKDIIEDAIRDYAFYYSDYPLIISLENHCSIPQQDVMANILKRTLGSRLYAIPLDADASSLPSPEHLRGKIIVKGHKLHDEAASSLVAEVFEEDSDDDGNSITSNDAEVQKIMKTKKKNAKIKVGRQLSDVTYIKSVPFQGFHVAKQQGKCHEISSYSEKRAVKLSDEQPNAFVQHSEMQLCRIYPAGTRADSSNYCPIQLWNVGAQLVALNYQTNDRWMQLYHGKFRDNGGSGYVLKPSFMRCVNSTFNPKGFYPDSWRTTVKMKIISGCHLPKPQNQRGKRDLVDPYVKVTTVGVDADYQEFKTKTVFDNGLSPQWNETFEFSIDVPQLAMITFVVKDFDAITADQDLGQFSMPFTSLTEGYRHVMLYTSDGQSLGPAAIFVHVTITAPRAGETNNNRSSASSDGTASLIRREVRPSSASLNGTRKKTSSQSKIP